MIRSLPRARPRDPLPGIAATAIAATLIAPWALGFSASHAAVAGHIAFAMTFGPIALLITALPAAALTTAAAGAWLMTSPWLLGYAPLGTTAWSPDLAAGLILVALSRRALRAGVPRETPAPAGPRPVQLRR
jgi:SPW repeat-containing protein